MAIFPVQGSLTVPCNLPGKISGGRRPNSQPAPPTHTISCILDYARPQVAAFGSLSPSLSIDPSVFFNIFRLEDDLGPRVLFRMFPSYEVVTGSPENTEKSIRMAKDRTTSQQV